MVLSKLIRVLVPVMVVSLHAQELQVVCVGDSHTMVEAGMKQQLSVHLNKPVKYTHIGIAGKRTKDFLTSIISRRGAYWEGLHKIKKPSLILIAFGSNDGGLPKLPSSYKLTWKRLLRELRTLYPATTLVMVGPPPCRGHKISLLPSIVAAQKETAKLEGVQFINRFIMGLSGMQPDGVHYSYRGYENLARQVVLQIHDPNTQVSNVVELK